MQLVEFGILTLDCIPLLEENSNVFESRLRSCINATATDENDWNFLRHSLSFVEIRNDTWVVRFASVDSKGRTFRSLAQISKLYDAVVSMAGRIGTVLEAKDVDPSRYHHFYNPQNLANNKHGRDYVFVPDSKFVKNIVIMLNSTAAIDCNENKLAIR